MNFLKIDRNNVDKLECFVKTIGSSVDTFRYYSHRNPLEAIANHLVTFLLLDGDSVGYGHLDEENGVVWLGICVKESCVGKGYGKSIMKELVNSYDGKICLTVDSSNNAAIGLYKKFGFVVTKENATVYMERRNDTSI
jgi:ribosomal protein S18 acetylase RimI-like enzyme|tara:strand:- start:416 stop:829 length:414 start_codon:yes stop_codon:yes gene_type:complete